jgi:hypothetical protein
VNTRVQTLPSSSWTRPLIAIAAVSALALSLLTIVGPAAAVDAPNTIHLHNTTADPGSAADCAEVEDGTVLYHFVLNGLAENSTLGDFEVFFSQGNVTVLSTTSEVKNTTVTHVNVTVDGDATLTDATATFDKAQPEGAKLVLSHICDKADEPASTPTPTPTPVEETASPTPTPVEETASPTPTPVEETASPTPTPTATPEGGELGSTGTPAPSPSTEQSVEAATGTPAPSVPNTAIGGGTGSQQIPTILFGLMLIASLGGLLVLNVKSAIARR